EPGRAVLAAPVPDHGPGLERAGECGRLGAEPCRGVCRARIVGPATETRDAAFAERARVRLDQALDLERPAFGRGAAGRQTALQRLDHPGATVGEVLGQPTLQARVAR